MEYSCLDVEVRDRVMTVTFNRPDHLNSFTMAAALELVDAFDRADADDEVRAVIITGSGSSFCAGADLDEGFVGRDADLTPKARAYLDRLGQVDGVPRDGGGWVALRIAAALKPVIVAFNGAAVGIGVTMSLPADVRIAAESARFGFVFASRGLVPEAASTWFLPRVVGISTAMEWVATGRIFGAAEAHERGLVTYVVPDDELLDRARRIAGEVVDRTSAVSVAASRRLMWSMLGASSPWDAHALESKAIYELAAAPDCREGIDSFFEKRSPEFPMSVSQDLPSFVPEWPVPGEPDRPVHLDHTKE